VCRLIYAGWSFDGHFPGQGLTRFRVDAHFVENRERFRDLQHKFTYSKYVIVNLLTYARSVQTSGTLLRVGEFDVTLRDPAVRVGDRSV
jgi:hypothetical protein